METRAASDTRLPRGREGGQRRAGLPHVGMPKLGEAENRLVDKQATVGWYSTPCECQLNHA